MVIFIYENDMFSVDIFKSKVVCYKDDYVVNVAMVEYIPARNPTKIPNISLGITNPFLAAKGKTQHYETFGAHQNHHCKFIALTPAPFKPICTRIPSFVRGI